MSIIKKSVSRKTKWQLSLIVLLILLAVGAVVLDVALKGPLTRLMENREEIAQLVRDAKILSPLVYILIYVVQSVLAPIPGQVAGIVGGYIFGWWGVLWSFIGTAIGFYLVFWLARKFGRPLVEKIVKKESLDKFDFLMHKGGGMIFFVIFLLPVFPDDVIGYIAGLTRIPIRTLLAMAVVGRMPAVVFNNLVGMGVEKENYWLLGAVVVLSIVGAIVLYFKRDVISKWLDRHSRSSSK
jgi:uncharacterized membrane protein YdjX (TVP38/TMEM64 family)